MDDQVQYGARVFGTVGDYEYGIQLDADGMFELSYSEPERPEHNSILTVAPDDVLAFLSAAGDIAKANGLLGDSNGTS